jgi:hypothetical protein
MLWIGDSTSIQPCSMLRAAEAPKRFSAIRTYWLLAGSGVARVLGLTIPAAVISAPVASYARKVIAAAAADSLTRVTPWKSNTEPEDLETNAGKIKW